MNNIRNEYPRPQFRRDNWQTLNGVWIEFFDADCIAERRIYSNFAIKSICGTITIQKGITNKLKVDVSFNGELICTQNYGLSSKNVSFNVSLEHFDSMLWSCDNPNLVYVDLSLYHDETLCDIVHTRIGLREITIENGTIKLNGKPLYQRLILDQGYWNESGLTPPTAQSLKQDILLAQQMGFNGARKHQKFEDPYFYYYAEELGFLVWCEMPSAYNFCEKEKQTLTTEWIDIVKEARNYTSVVAYVPLNESWGVECMKADLEKQQFAKDLYFLTKSLDDSRIVSTNDGFENVQDSDILSIHDYDIKLATNSKQSIQAITTEWFRKAGHFSATDISILVNRYCLPSLAELLTRLNELITGILSTEFQGYCYTQLTDVQQEVNGLLCADRTQKCSLDSYKRLFGKSPKKDLK